MVWGKNKDLIVEDIVRAVLGRHWHWLTVTEHGGWEQKLLTGEMNVLQRFERVCALHCIDSLS